ncbi:MAG: acyl-CoA/acyl-ACP dehydrogenase [Candidatus Methanomethylicia archaeon]|nr:acyl-CoA/acyl-ACP dehydrogenase [Candidatus Methanomethylicia archaeon]
MILNSPPINYPKDPIITFNQDEEMFRNTVREFCERYISPIWIKVDEEASKDPMNIPIDLYVKMAEQGLFAIPCSSKFGGQDGTYTMVTIAIEEISYYDPSVAIAVYTLLNNGWPFALQLFGNEEICQEIIPRVARGEAFFGIATTEPHGGSDIAGIKTIAKRSGSKYVFNGEKAYISGVGEIQKLSWGGGWFLVARTGPTGHRGLSAFAFLASKNGTLCSGFHPTIYHDIGRHGLTTGGFILENFELDAKYLLGEENKGFYYVMEGFNLARILVSAACVGAMKWLLEKAAEWFKQRKLFEGRYISQFQGVSFPFAESYAKYEAARYFVYRASRLADKIYLEKDPTLNPRDLNVPVALAKMWAPLAVADLAEEVMKWYGAFAYTKECPIYRSWLGTFSYTIGAEGAQNIMKYIIARDLLGSEYVRS